MKIAMIKKELAEILVCPKCKGAVIIKEKKIICKKCKKYYPIENNVPVMLEEKAKKTE